MKGARRTERTHSLEGRFADGETLSSEALSMGQRFGIRLADPLTVYRAHFFWRGFLASMLAPLEEALRKFAEAAPGQPFAQLPLARWLVDHGELASARQRLEACPKEDLLAALDYPAFLETITVVASELKDQPLCDTVRSRLLPHRGLNLIFPQFCLCWGPAARYLALASWGIRDWQAASDYFEEAHAMCDALLATTHSILVSCDWARMLAERGGRGDRRAALGLLTDAQTNAARLHAPGLIQKCEAARAQVSA